MNKHFKRRVMSHSKFLVTVALAFLLSGGNVVMASQIVENNSLRKEEQLQNQSISGTVVDSQNEPIIGANVIEKGTTNGTITDLDGRFTLNVQAGTTLVFSYLGYRSQEIQASRNMSVILIEDNKLLDEVVVIGYGVQKKKLVTGATVQVKGEDIAKLNTVNVLEAMQSQSPGVNITQNNGFLGAGFKVNIRGLGTIGSFSPLYVIDGVAGGDISGLNSNDIESIDVLKDAASAAIYGARAANGVILVTTKRGKAGQSQISYDAYYGLQNLYKIPTLLNAKEYMAMQDEGRIMDGLDPYNWPNLIPQADLTAIENGSWKGTNWLKEILNKDAPIQSHSLNFTGGNDLSTYGIGLSYLRQEASMGVPGAFPYMDRYNARINSTHILKKKGNLNLITIGETLNYRYQQTKGSFATGGIYWNGVHNMLIMSPLMHAYNKDSNYYLYQDQVDNGYNWDTANSANKNPIAYLDYMANQNLSKTYSLQGSFNIEIQPIKDLKLKSQFGYIMGASSYRSYSPEYPKLTATLEQSEDRVIQSQSSYHRWLWENTANYIFNIDNHNFDVLLGQSIEKWGMGESMSGTKTNSSFYDFEHAYLSNVPGTTTTTALTGTPNSPGAIASFFGRVNYNYQEKYMASLIMRADGSSTFARGNRWGYFPSVSAGWVLSNEEFMSSTTTWLDFLKLRASFGQNGNCNVEAFQYMAVISSNNNWGGYPFGNKPGDAATGSYAYRLTNPDLKWETQEQFNIGIDARFFNSRLAVELDWYNRMTRDWLVTAPIPMSFGADPTSVNGGNVRNRGFEVALHWNDNIGKDFNYGINWNLGYNKNKVTKIANENGVIEGPGSMFWEGADICYRVEVGKPIGYFYGYKSDGIFQNTEQIKNHKGALLNGDKTQPGDVIWRDVYEDGVIDQNDRTMLGKAHPDYTMGFSLNFDWKGIDLSISGYGAFGHQIMKCYRDFSSSPYNNFTDDVYDRWHGEGTSNKYPRLSFASSTNWSRISDIYIEDADYLKIKNVTLGYDFKKLLKSLPVEQLRLYASIQNLFTITGYSGMDPEVGFASEDSQYNWGQGIDLGYYPSARTFMIGANIKF